ncbi:MAG: lytic murein transglycosylase [Candidatus Brennerbacteria bacterium]
MRRNLVHTLMFLVAFAGAFYSTKHDVKRKKIEAGNSHLAVRVWAPEDTAFVSFLTKVSDSLTVVTLFNDVRFGIDDDVVARFAEARRARSNPAKRRAPYAWLFTDSSVARGKQFLSQYREFLDSVAQPFGVPSRVIAALLRTESDFGEAPGEYVVANTLYTAARLAENSTQRNPELRELSALLQIMQGGNIDLFLALRGSWRGAFGFPQFRPTSYLAYGVDGNGDDVVDLFALPDAVASASNYLRAHGWSPRHRDQRRALYAYNRGGYADAVLSYAARIATN